MAEKLPRLKADEIINVLTRHGFTLVSQRGSHQKWRNDTTRKQVIVQLLNRTSQEQLIPIGGAKIRLAETLGELQAAYLTRAKETQLDTERVQDGTQIALPPIGLHEIAILQL